MVSTIVSTEWLVDVIKQQDTTQGHTIRILDVTFDRYKVIDTYKDCYLKEHIPQSLHFDLHHCVKSTPEIPRSLPDIESFTQYIRSLGISTSTHVVVYDREDMVPAFRTWWLFRLYGHSNISILDGGLVKWKINGYDVTFEQPNVEPSNDFKITIDTRLMRSYDDMLKIVNKTKHDQIVDSRLLDDPKVLSRELDGGLIPGSIRVPYSEFFNKDFTMKDADDMKEILRSCGVDIQSAMVTTCNTGMTACCIAAVMKIVKQCDIPVYYGSWTEWKKRSPDELKQRV
ncbi:hypothetical protein ACF0H5_021815 [Mactra antiquata]